MVGSLGKDRDIRRFLAGSAALILCLIFTGGFLLFRQMEDIKKVYLQQQAEAAGALLEAGVDPARAAKLLAGEISEEMAAQGRLLTVSYTHLTGKNNVKRKKGIDNYICK